VAKANIMSNLSDVGFPTSSNEDLNNLIEKWLENVAEIPSRKGTYLKFGDESGAEIYLQMDHGGDLTGLNPYFAGKSRRKVFLTEFIERDSSELDGAFHAWANAEKEGEGDYPFVLDLPDAFTYQINLPLACEIQLNAFATNDLQVFESEGEFLDSQTEEIKFAAHSFIPIGLFRQNEGIPPQAHGQFAGTVKEFELKTNQMTGKNFYWFLVETLGGEIDVVSDPNYVKKEPQINSIIHGSFWLTGKITA
jgi:hypothetical protein